MIDWVCRRVLEDIRGHQLLQFAHECGMVQHLNQATRLRLGQVFLTLDLVLPRIPNDTGSFELVDQKDKCDHAVIRMRLSLQGLEAADKYGRNFSGLDKSEPLNVVLQTQWEVARGSEFVDRQWESVKSNLLAITSLVALPYGIVRKGLPPWWGSRITRARKRNHKAYIT